MATTIETNRRRVYGIGLVCTICGKPECEHPFLKPQLPAEQKRKNRNARRRAENAILREVSGTSARAAREDMGL